VSFLELENISKSFGGTKALDAVEFELDYGEVHCLIGGNGSGKSTMIKIISGLQPPDYGGIIRVEGKAYDHLTPIVSAKLGIQVIYQDLSLFPNLTIAENIAAGLHRGWLHGVNWSKIRSVARAAMHKIGVELDMDHMVMDLPIATRQLVAISRALAAEARLIIMDEPTASLTRHEVDALLALIDRLKGQGVSILFISHRFDEVIQIADRVTIIRDGVKLGTHAGRQMSEEKLAALMTGQELPPTQDRLLSKTAPDKNGCKSKALNQKNPVLSVENLTRKHHYENISFCLYKGEVLGLTGLLGAGRTELALSLFGMNPPDHGTIRLDGRVVNLTSNRRAIEQAIAYVPEDRLSLSLNLDQSISHNMIVTSLKELKNKFGLLARRAQNRLIRQYVKDLKIKLADPSHPVQTLSGGNQQRVVLAKWLATRPKILILDSPTVGVDFHGKAGLYAIIRQLAQKGVSILMISDEIEEVLFNSDRILVMRGGKINGEFLSCETSAQQLKEAVYA